MISERYGIRGAHVFAELFAHCRKVDCGRGQSSQFVLSHSKRDWRPFCQGKNSIMHLFNVSHKLFSTHPSLGIFASKWQEGAQKEDFYQEVGKESYF